MPHDITDGDVAGRVVREPHLAVVTANIFDRDVTHIDPDSFVPDRCGKQTLMDVGGNRQAFTLGPTQDIQFSFQVNATAA